MSGGGGGNWRPEPTPVSKSSKGGSGSGGGSGGDDPCNLVEATTLNSPDPGVLATLRAGDQLSVILQAGPPRRLVARTKSGDVAGSITGPSMAQIIQCIGDGRAYVAEVTSVRGGLCRIEVRPA